MEQTTESKNRPALTQHNPVSTQALKQITGNSILKITADQLNIHRENHEA